MAMEANTVDFATLFSFEDEDEHIFVNRSLIKGRNIPIHKNYADLGDILSNFDKENIIDNTLLEISSSPESNQCVSRLYELEKDNPCPSESSKNMEDIISSLDRNEIDIDNIPTPIISSTPEGDHYVPISPLYDFNVDNPFPFPSMAPHLPYSYAGKIVKSPLDTRGYYSFTSVDGSPCSLIQFFDWIISKLNLGEESDLRAVTDAPPWHVSESCTFILDLNSLNDRTDTFIDCWNWSNAKTYKTYGKLGCPKSFTKTKIDSNSNFCFTKRTWDCQQSEFIKKSISAIYPPGLDAQNQKSPLDNACRFVVIQYFFSELTGVVQPSSKIRTYPSVKREVRN